VSGPHWRSRKEAVTSHRQPAPQRGVSGTVLIVEDQPAVAKALRMLFEIHGIDAIASATSEEAASLVARGEADLVVQDMNFTPGATSGDEGVALFRRLRQIDPRMPIVLLTAWTSLETAVQMVKEGATDYLAKPWSDEKLLTIVQTLLGAQSGERERRGSRSTLASTFDLCGIVYDSAAMHRVITVALQVAAADIPVLITGPNGAGKEKIAEIIQANSARRKKPFVKVNAGALPDELLESELFGAEQGAFTGSARLRIGRFEMANGGTLLLDEIGNLSAAGQMKLLRVLQVGEFERLGSSETRRVDVRVICATNSDLREAARRGTFRQDLLFRIDVIEIRVPPLRERRDDILPLATAFLAAAGKGGGRSLRLTDDARAALLEHDWSGNVRELQNRIQRGLVTASGDTIAVGDLGLGSAATAAEAAVTAAGEKEHVVEVLRRFGGSVSEAARALGLSRQALYRRMERLGIVLERRPKE
jgi:DNA-binding NtrC family response regulator